MVDKIKAASQLDQLAAQEMSLARGQELAARADRLRGFTKSIKMLSLPFSRNWSEISPPSITTYFFAPSRAYAEAFSHNMRDHVGRCRRNGYPGRQSPRHEVNRYAM